MSFQASKALREVKEYYGIKVRARDEYMDTNIIYEVMGEDVYRVPLNAKVVIDIGAHIGTFSLLAAKRGAETIYAFEPERFNYSVLKENVELNGYKINCINMGVGIPGETKLYVSPINSGATSSFLRNKTLSADKFQIVQFLSIHEVFDGIQHCDILKLDCEGSEKDIINDFDDDLASRVSQISVEFHEKSIRDGLIKKLERWYSSENTSRKSRTWVFRKRVLLHIGCGNRRHEGFINSDKEMDITKPWPYDDESVDGIVSQQVYQQIEWRGLLAGLREAYRVLKKGGVMRFGTVLVESSKPLEWILGFQNINLFSFGLLKKVLRRIGFKDIRTKKYRDSLIPKLAETDNRHIGKGTYYIEAVK